VARASLAALVESGFVDVLEPAVDAPPPPEPIAAPREPEWSPPAPQWAAPAPEVEPAVQVVPEPAPQPASESWERPAPPAQSWEQPAPAAQSWERPVPPPQWSQTETDLREDLAAALDARMGALQTPAVEPEVAPPPAPPDIPAEPDERLAALSGLFGPAQPDAPAPDVAPAPPQDRINEWSQMAPAMQTEVPVEEKKRGRFGFLKREDPAREADPAMLVEPAETAPTAGRAGQLASLANALLGEYNSGHYGKGRLDDRMANLLMRVDEQADPIDRPLPIVDDRIDSQALDRENVPEQQAVPYLALLVTQIYEDAERTFGKDKAKKGYRAAQQQVFGTDASALGAPDVAGRLPKV